MNTKVSHRHQRGLSIVEMMVGVAIGLLVVAASAMVVSGQLLENRRLVIETQVQQDLRAATDIITRELRRSGHWISAPNGIASVPGATVACNRYATLAPSGAEADTVGYRYQRAAGSDRPLGFKVEGGVLRSATSGAGTVDATTCTQSTSASGWQDLTDVRTLKITNLTVRPRTVSSQTLPCPKLCTDGSTDCWPTLVVRELTVDISGEAANDPSVQRSMRSTVRLRNDFVRFNDAANPTRMCPP